MHLYVYSTLRVSDFDEDDLSTTWPLSFHHSVRVGCLGNGFFADFFAWPCRVVSRSCVRIFSRILPRIFLRFYVPQKKSAQKSAHNLACTAGQKIRVPKHEKNPRKPCPETQHQGLRLWGSRPLRFGIGSCCCGF